MPSKTSDKKKWAEAIADMEAEIEWLRKRITRLQKSIRECTANLKAGAAWQKPADVAVNPRPAFSLGDVNLVLRQYLTDESPVQSLPKRRPSKHSGKK